MSRAAALAVAVLAIVALSGCGAAPQARPAPARARRSETSAGAAGRTSSAAPVPSRPRHVVVVIMENHSYSEIIGNPAAPYINGLARHGRSLTHMRAITHPSQPNYMALFSGRTHVLSDSCPHSYPGRNLGSQLLAAGDGFVGWSESLPHTGSQVCSAGEYARKHAPWVNFTNLPRRTNRPFRQFPKNYAKLPAVSFVVPNLRHDMHDGTIGQGDRWLRRNVAGYARWAKAHDSLLVVTWDEDDLSAHNHIATIITGAGVGHGPLARPVTTYSLLRLLEDLYGLPHLGNARTAPVIPLR